MKKKPRILIVDSNPANLSELERLLSSLEVDIVRALSGKQAADLAQAEAFCLAIASVSLPDMNGYTLIELIRPLPVILLHAHYPDEAMFRKGCGAGAADILSWTVLPDVLAARARPYVALARQRSSSEKLVIVASGENPGQKKGADEWFDWLSQSMEQIAQAMASTLDMVEVPRLVLEQLPAVVPYNRGSILLRDGDTLRMVATRGFPPGWPISDARIPIRQGDVFQQIVETRQALLIDDVSTTSAWQQVEGLPLDRSWLGVPLLSKDHVIGMVSLTRKEAAAFKPEEVSFIRASASQAAVALINTSLLTELKRFNEHLEHIVHERTEELKQAYARLEKIDQTKTSFISVATHELRTPLTLINGYTSLLGSIVKENKEAIDLVQGILTGERRMLDIVNSMVDVSKIDNQVLEVRKTPISLWLIVRIIHSEFKTALKDRHIELSIGNMENFPEIQADAELLGKLFRHLIGNAIKYTPDGGFISIQGRLIPGIDCGQKDSGQKEWIEIIIKDTGIGIDPANHELIFEKFYQMGPVELHSSGKTKFKGGGPGLGLAISRGIVRAHGGRIWVESPGYDEASCLGSCFHVMLPVT